MFLEYDNSTNDTVMSMDYSILTFAKYNRKIDKTHVDMLKGVMRKVGFWSHCPILVGEDLVICDGQHRFQAAKELQIPFHYRVVPGADFDMMITLNRTPKTWTQMAWVETWAGRGRKDYIALLNFVNETGLPLSCCMVLSKGATSSTRNRPHTIASGDYRFDITKAREMWGYAKAYEGVFPNGYKLRTFLQFLFHVVKSGVYNHDKWLRKCKMNRAWLYPCPDIHSYVPMFEKIVSYHESKELRIVIPRKGKFADES